MNSQTAPQQRLDWSEILPWTLIFRTLAPACSLTVIALALIGVVATPMGWIVAESLFIGSEDYLDQNPIVAEIAEINRSPYRGVFLASEQSSGKFSVLGTRLSGPRLVFEQMVKPFYAVFGTASSAQDYLYFLTGSLWSLLIWSFVGLGIARVCLLKLARNESAGLDDAFEFCADKYLTCLLAVAMPLGLAFLICVPAFLIGLVLGFDVGAMLVGLVWFVVLLMALLLGILLLGLMVGWPLIICSVAAEGQNSFDAVTRAYAYVFQRPANYLLYALVAIFFGGFCWLVVHEFTGSVIRLGFWSTGWGANRVSANRIEELQGVLPSSRSMDNFAGVSSNFQDPLSATIQTDDPVASDTGIEPDQDAGGVPPTAGDPPATDAGGPQLGSVPPATTDLPKNPDATSAADSESQTLAYARKFIQFWVAFAKTVAAAFIHGLFWCMASAIYLLLRKDVDELEMDEVFMVDERRTYDLPPLKSDEQGVPQVQPMPLDEEPPTEQ